MDEKAQVGMILFLMALAIIFVVLIVWGLYEQNWYAVAIGIIAEIALFFGFRFAI